MNRYSSPRRIAAHRRALEEVGYPPGEFVSAGFFGVVFRSTTPGRLVEVTHDFQAGQFLAWAASVGGHPCFPTGYLFAEVGRYQHKPLFAFEREEIGDLPLVDAARFHWAVDDLVRSVGHIPSPASAWNPSHEAWLGATARAAAAVDAQDAWAVESLAAGLWWALAQCCSFEEIEIDSLGLRDGHVVVRDLGKAISPPRWRFTPPKVGPPVAA